MLLLILVLVILGIIFYKNFVRPLSKWKRKGIAYIKNAYPIAGNFLNYLLRKVSFAENFIDLYNEHPDKSFVGMFQFSQPAILIRDLELIKQITVKNFDNFIDHRHVGNDDIDILFSKNLAQLNGQTWREMRATLSPAFTGSKMKAMFGLISDCAKQIADHFEKKDEKISTVDMKDLFNRYANDVIATCAFGVKCDSINHPKNDFYVMGQNATDFSGIKSLKFLIFTSIPKLGKLLGFKLFEKEITEFFINTITETIKYRTDNNVIRPDMIHLLMEARKGKLKHEDTYEDRIDKGFAVVEESSIGKQAAGSKEISDIDIAAQAFIFFFAGFETSSTILSFTFHELALNPDIQEKLYQEIKGVIEDCDDKLTYEAVMAMTYLDMVVSELLRKWPPGPVTDRECSKNFILKTPDQEDYLIEKGDLVFIPILPLHRDEKYFENPNKFDPERFSEENRKNIVPYSYIPFGVGPRACVGSRFALMQAKVIIIHLLHKFEIVPVEKTVVPLVLTKRDIRMRAEGGFWLGLKNRQK